MGLKEVDLNIAKKKWEGEYVLCRKGKNWTDKNYSEFLADYPLAVAKVSNVVEEYPGGRRERLLVLVLSKDSASIWCWSFNIKDVRKI